MPKTSKDYLPKQIKLGCFLIDIELIDGQVSLNIAEQQGCYVAREQIIYLDKDIMQGQPEQAINLIIHELMHAIYYQYNLSTAYDASTASYASKSFSVGSQITSGTVWSIDFNDTGTILYAISSGATIYQYTLSTAFDIATASYASKSYEVYGPTGKFKSGYGLLYL